MDNGKGVMPEATCSTCPFYFEARHECRGAMPTAVLFAPEKFTPDLDPVTNEVVGGTVTVMGGKQPTSYFPPQRPDSWCGNHPLRRSGQVFPEIQPRQNLVVPGMNIPVDLLKGIVGS